MADSYAFYDSLSVGTKIQETLGDVAIAEVHVFAYLACLLSLYKHQPVSEWGYQFAGTSSGAPFSQEINTAVENMQRMGIVVKNSGQFMKITEKGTELFARLSEFSQYAGREIYLTGACSSSLALPVTIIREALLMEPGLRSAARISERLLLKDNNPSLTLLYEQFKLLSSSVGVDIDNLMAPAVVWLTYLAKSSRPEDI